MAGLCSLVAGYWQTSVITRVGDAGLTIAYMGNLTQGDLNAPVNLESPLGLSKYGLDAPCIQSASPCWPQARTFPPSRLSPDKI